MGIARAFRVFGVIYGGQRGRLEVKEVHTVGVEQRVRELVEPVVALSGLDLYDVELASGILRVTVDRQGGVDVDAIGEISHAISRLLDDEDVISDTRYLLEVSSPGIERRLRTPEHFAANVDTEVRVRLTHAIDGVRRFDGRLVAATPTRVEIEIDGNRRTFAHEDISDARTIFDWSTALNREPDVDLSDSSSTTKAQSSGRAMEKKAPVQ